LIERACRLVKYEPRGKRHRLRAAPPTHSASEAENVARSRC
jgi:hypothetical protein